VKKLDGAEAPQLPRKSTNTTVHDRVPDASELLQDHLRELLADDTSKCYYTERRGPALGCAASCKCQWYEACVPKYAIWSGRLAGRGEQPVLEWVDIGICSTSMGYLVLLFTFLWLVTVGISTAVRMSVRRKHAQESGMKAQPSLPKPTLPKPVTRLTSTYDEDSDSDAPAKGQEESASTAKKAPTQAVDQKASVVIKAQAAKPHAASGSAPAAAPMAAPVPSQAAAEAYPEGGSGAAPVDQKSST